MKSLTVTLSALQSKTSFPLRGLPNGVFALFCLCSVWWPMLLFRCTEYFVLCLLCQLNMPEKWALFVFILWEIQSQSSLIINCDRSVIHLKLPPSKPPFHHGPVSLKEMSLQGSEARQVQKSSLIFAC